ncbi:tigger transposable element-derived protein 4-like isoform X1 [Heptranchias perlo]|uniref:tigger transposable element-derived protein 4-like isoform X1 n=1 Tax=Heptranchias perlo TaxID=212740 RepID=UPI00355A8C58
MTGKRKSMSLGAKIDLLSKIDELPKMSHRDLAQHLGLPKSTVSDLLKQRDKLYSEWHRDSNPNRKRKREGKDREVEEALLRWFQNAHGRDALITGRLLAQKAKQLAAALGKPDFNPSEGWLQRWKSRHNIVFRRPHGEKLSSDWTGAELWMEDVLPGLLEGYGPQDIFNCDETGVFYRCIGYGTLALRGEAALGQKKARERLSVMACCNMDGTEKCDLLVIGKSQNPRCFRGVHHLPVTYRASKTAWMTGDIFCEWVRQWDRRLVDRQVVLILDNFSGHPRVSGLRNIRLVFHPVNTARLTQPLDQGIIYCMKQHYVKAMREKVLEEMDGKAELTAAQCVKRISLLDAVRLLKDAWDSVDQQTIQRCFKKAGFLTTADESAGEMQATTAPDGLSEEEFSHLCHLGDHNAPYEAETDDIGEVVDAMRAQKEEEGEQDPDSEESLVTPADVRSAVLTLRRAMEQHPDIKPDWETLRKVDLVWRPYCLRKRVQTRIPEFFGDL